MSEEEALLAAIAESPWDSTPRSIYADWLEDHGRSREADTFRDEWVECPCVAEAKRLGIEKLGCGSCLHGMVPKKMATMFFPADGKPFSP